MNIKVKVNSQGYAYLPKGVREAGYTGTLQGMPNHCTFVLLRPGSSLKQVKQSLEVLIHDLTVRMEDEAA